MKERENEGSFCGLEQAQSERSEKNGTFAALNRLTLTHGLQRVLWAHNVT